MESFQSLRQSVGIIRLTSKWSMKDGLKGEPNPRREEYVGNSTGIQGQRSWPKLEEGSLQIQDTFSEAELKEFGD